MGTSSHNYVLVRDLRTPLPALELPREFQCVAVQQSGDDRSAALEAFCHENGFPSGWAQQMLERGARGWLLLNDNQAVGAGWITRGPFYVDEIRRSFDAGIEGEYFFGDFISPAFRGHGLHRHLILQRLLAAARSDRRWAMAMTSGDNTRSTAGYQTQGFAVAGKLTVRHFAHYQMHTFRRIPDLPSGEFSHNGLRLPGIGRLLRA